MRCLLWLYLIVSIIVTVICVLCCPPHPHIMVIWMCEWSTISVRKICVQETNKKTYYVTLSAIYMYIYIYALFWDYKTPTVLVNNWMWSLLLNLNKKWVTNCCIIIIKFWIDKSLCGCSQYLFFSAFQFKTHTNLNKNMMHHYCYFFYLNDNLHGSNWGDLSVYQFLE